MSRLKIFSVLSAFLTSFTAFAQLNGNQKLPKTWEKDFVITLSFNNSMSSTRTVVRFTFDSCTYSNESSNEKRTYAMQESDRVEILKKLKDLKAGQIKSEGRLGTEHDGWAQSIRFGFHTIEGGSSAWMSEKDKNRFLEAYHYLEAFAMKKTS